MLVQETENQTRNGKRQKQAENKVDKQGWDEPGSSEPSQVQTRESVQNTTLESLTCSSEHSGWAETEAPGCRWT